MFTWWGVLKDYPSLSLYKDKMNSSLNLFSSSNNIHIQYNEDVRKLDKNFINVKNKRKILVIGDSFGRDVVNIFYESSILNNINISYFYIGRMGADKTLRKRMDEADIIILAASKYITKEEIPDIGEYLSKVTCFGVKNFGYNNGIHYNRIDKIQNYTNYYTNLKEGTLNVEKKLKKEWGSKYISLLDPIINQQGQVRVFTPDGKFISQDTQHLTKNGAMFYAHILETKLKKIVE